MKIMENLWQVGGAEFTTVEDAAIYLIEFGPLKVLFGQDVHGPLVPSLLSNREDYHNSLNFMLDLDVDLLCEGHFGIYRGKEEVRKFIGSFLIE
jgi:hypothetical protein